MKYRVIRRYNPQDRTQSKFYASPVKEGTVTKTVLAKDLVDISSLSRGDVSSVIENLIGVIPKYLLMGRSVNLGELGTLRVSFGSEGVDDPKDLNATRISGVKIVFTPGVELKEELRKIHFERETTASSPEIVP